MSCAQLFIPSDDLVVSASLIKPYAYGIPRACERKDVHGVPTNEKGGDVRMSSGGSEYRVVSVPR